MNRDREIRARRDWLAILQRNDWTSDRSDEIAILSLALRLHNSR